MDADFSVELGNEDAVLDFPWTDPDGKLAYFDLKRHPDLLAQVPEAKESPELGEFLRLVNSAKSMVESAKCDVWTTEELSPEEETFGASHKVASYVDLVLSRIEDRPSFPSHEIFAKKLVELLRRAPEIQSAAELCIRRCYFGDENEGFYCTLYVSGYGGDPAGALQNWEIGLRLTGSAILQLSAAAWAGAPPLLDA